ncbi:RING and ubiquitin domain protein [Pandoravirus inopinatum]|uniref:RING and ubiquitin domain protein n=1 Tax=Pandoravirus inopinatum TaxID=1605721 RepID=A0A0B5J1L8_9VIRU|nr:RING and ubiquitin domain protein [Pandoravirus inopinatum]AJF97409.1 RING and ubiquitin domain protein [Pandoravirus inopinatum]
MTDLFFLKKDNRTLGDYGVEDGARLNWQLACAPQSGHDGSLDQTEDDPIVIVITRPDGGLVDIKTVDRTKPIATFRCVYRLHYIHHVVADRGLTMARARKNQIRAWARDYLLALNGETLDQDKTWAEHGIEAGTWLSIVPKPSRCFQLFITTLTGAVCTVCRRHHTILFFFILTRRAALGLVGDVHANMQAR